MTKSRHKASRKAQRGSVLVLAAFSMAILLGMAALAIDLAALYAARIEAQRAADAAALAGARVLGGWGGPLCNSSITDAGAQNAARSLAEAAATAVGNENFVAGKPASITEFNITPNYGMVKLFGVFEDKKNPVVKVTVRRQGTAAEPMTFFARYWGFWGDVSAEASAEAYVTPAVVVPPLPDALRPAVGTVCVKPWLLHYCNPDGPLPPASCPGSEYIDPNTGALRNNLLGRAVSIAPQAPPLPSSSWRQFLPVTLPGETAPGEVAYGQEIMNCHPTPSYCGQTVTLNSTVTAVPAKTTASVNSLIQRNDTLANPTFPFRIVAGDSGKSTNSSNSVVSLPLYRVAPVGATYRIVGFLQMFVESVDSTGKISGRVLGATGCEYLGAGSYTPDSKSLISDGTMMCPGVEVRLVQPRP